MNLLDRFKFRVKQHPDRPAYIFLQDGELETDRLTYQELGSPGYWMISKTYIPPGNCFGAFSSPIL